MPFNSLKFLLFLGASACGYAMVAPRRRIALLLTCSLFYYASWHPAFVVLLLGACAVAYGAGLHIERSPRTAGPALSAALIALLGCLAFFKYVPALAVFSTGTHAWMSLAVPVGISYYTFKLLSYVIDVYWGKIPAERSFVRLSAYAAFFPQILSGPIGRATQSLPEMSAARAPGGEEVMSALRLILFGWFQKAVVADRLGAMIDSALAQPAALSGWPLLLVVYGYCWRLYADFSGISDIAIGSARLFGLGSPQNFASPFYAPNIQEFWRRWHMSLTSWLTDYVFTPLRMAWRSFGALGLCASLMITLLLIGAWHGPRLNFILFGAINGLYMVVSALTLRSRDRFFEARPAWARLRGYLGPIITFHLVAFSFVFFQSPTPRQALSLLSGLLKPAQMSREFLFEWRRSADLAVFFSSLLVMEAVHVYQLGGRFRAFVHARPRWVVLTAFYTAVAAALLLSRSPAKGFIYFQF